MAMAAGAGQTEDWSPALHLVLSRRWQTSTIWDIFCFPGTLVGAGLETAAGTETSAYL